jgi:hypothetical protein
VCGVGGTVRKWYVDLNLAIDNYFNPVNDGAVYLCNECWDEAVRAVGNQAQVFMLGQEPWQAPVEITYTDEDELLLGEQDYGTGLPSESPGDIDNSTTGDDQPTETIDSESDTDDNDDKSEPVQQFREFFGKPV